MKPNWQSHKAGYLEATAESTRKRALTRVDSVSASLAALPIEQQQLWAEWFCSYQEEQKKIPLLSASMVDRVLLPILSAGARSGRPNHARWLALLILKSPAFRASASKLEAGPRCFLQWALAQDPKDLRALEAFCKLEADGIKYSLHELPAGVLRSEDESWSDMLQDLQEFEDLVTSNLPDREDYLELIAKARFHYNRQT